MKESIVTSNLQCVEFLLSSEELTAMNVVIFQRFYYIVHKLALKWLLLFIGDWHELFNHQKVLMKVYCEVGLKDLAKGTGFTTETLISLKNTSKFKRTHAFDTRGTL